MKIQIEKHVAEALVQQFTELTNLLEQLKLGSRVEVPFYELTTEQLGYLGDIYSNAGHPMKSRAAQIRTLESALGYSGTRYREGELESLVADVIEFLLQDGIRGWLFQATVSAKPIAWLVTRIDFTRAH